MSFLFRNVLRRPISLRPPSLAERIQPPPRPLSRSPFSTFHPRQQRYGPQTVGYGAPKRPGGGGGRVMSDWRTRLALTAGAGGGVYYVYHLEQVPQTGRYRFMDVSPAYEAEVAEQSFKQLISEVGPRLLPPSHPITRYVQTVAGRIVSAAGLGTVVTGGTHGVAPRQGRRGTGGSESEWSFGGTEGESDFGDTMANDSQWEVFVINDPKTKNAFVLPGRKIFVYTGILPIAGNDDGLATVLGHEIAHQVVRHGAERMSQYKVLMFLGYMVQFLLGVDVGLANLGLTLLMQLPNSRKQESEADRIGLRLMAQACFDPRESTQLWVRMSESEGKAASWTMLATSFMGTHPTNERRIRDLQCWTPEALDIRAASPCGDSLSSKFEAFKEDVSARVSSVIPGSLPQPAPRPSARVEPQPQPQVEQGMEPTWQDPWAEKPEKVVARATEPERRGARRDEKTKPVGQVDPVDEQWSRWIPGKKP